MAPPTIGRDLMARTWWATCPHGCGWSISALAGPQDALDEHQAHAAACTLAPGPAPPAPIAPPPLRPV